MCVICYIPKNRELPHMGVLEAMYLANPDGAGFCTPSANYKSLDFEEFLSRLQYRRDDEPCLLHFRLATHGSVCDRNCHPFYDETEDMFFMHNGILDIMPNADMTDSETAFRDIIMPAVRRYGLMSQEVAFVADRIRGYSKFAFMQGDKVLLLGDYIDRDGLYYSNLRFEYNMKYHRYAY